MKSRHLALGLVASALLAAPLLAQANTLPVATGSESMYPDLGQSGFGTLTWYAQPGASATALPGSASAASAAGDTLPIEALSYYYFEVVGPAGLTPPTATVDLIGTTAATSGGALAYGEAFMGSQLFSYSCAGPGCSTTGPSLALTATVDLNTPVEIGLEAVAEAGAGTALADPYITIDPSTPNADLLSIEVSAGVSNVPPSPVPLPAALPLLLSGLGGVVFIARQRRRALTAV
jgi:hypothetical protein